MHDLKKIVGPAVLALLWLGECWKPFYDQFSGRRRAKVGHDLKNLLWGAVGAGIGALAAAYLLAAVDAAAARRGVGLLRGLDWPEPLLLAAAIVLLDLWMYVWHWANHVLPPLWRFHRMHHTDPAIDASSGVRFHLGEIALSWLARLAIVPLLGMGLARLAIYETLLLPVVLFHHSNVRLPRGVDRALATLIVTPAMHRVHHSQRRRETNSNYGSLLPYWDRLLGSFRRRDDQQAICFGLPEFPEPRWQTLSGMAATPLANTGQPVAPSD